MVCKPPSPNVELRGRDERRSIDLGSDRFGDLGDVYEPDSPRGNGGPSARVFRDRPCGECGGCADSIVHPARSLVPTDPFGERGADRIRSHGAGSSSGQPVDPARVRGRIRGRDCRPVPPEPGKDGVAAADAVPFDGPLPRTVPPFLARSLPLVLNFIPDSLDLEGAPVLDPAPFRMPSFGLRRSWHGRAPFHVAGPI